MGNLSKQKRNELLSFLSKLREEHIDDESSLIFNKIENALNEKKYGLIFEEYEERVDMELKNNIPVYTEIKEKEIKKNNEESNFLIEGDNLHSLYLLEKTHKERINVIYIDPPYNTGNKDFFYDDNFIVEEDAFRHSKWLSFMEKRLKIARNLLSEDGIIFVSIDDNESSQLKLLMDEIFGSINYMTTLYIQVRYSGKSLTEEKPFKPVIECIYVYAKDSKKIDLNRPTEEYTDKKFVYKIDELSEGEDFYIGNEKCTVFKKGEWSITKKNEPQKDLLKETWISGSIYTKMSYGQVFRKFVEPRIEEDGLSCLYKVYGRGDDGLGYRYYTGPKRTTATRGKMFSGIPLSRLREMENGMAIRRKPIDTFYDFAADFGNIRHEGKVTFNSGKKPVRLIKQLINYHKNKNAIVLDFFAGSGTTGEAVLALNKEDGGSRKFILCTNNENGICEKITYKRLENVFHGYHTISKKKTLLFEKNIKLTDLRNMNSILEEVSTIKNENINNFDSIKSSFDCNNYKLIGTKKIEEIIEGYNSNLKYYKTDFIPRYNLNDKTIFLSDELMKHIIEMIQLENHLNVNGITIKVALTFEEFESILNNIENLEYLQKIYIASYIFISAKEMEILKNNNIEILLIPNYYFINELIEVGEL